MHATDVESVFIIMIALVGLPLEKLEILEYDTNKLTQKI